MKNKSFVHFMPIFAACLACNLIFAEPADNLRLKFIKGNIADKTAAVKDASGENKSFLSRKAIEFVLENKESVDNDRDFAMLAVAAVLSLPDDYYASLEKDKKIEMEKNLAEIFQIFSDSTVKIAVTNKILQISKMLEGDMLTNVLNDFVANAPESGITVLPHVVQALGMIGNVDSLKLIYAAHDSKKYESLTDNFESAIGAIAPKYFDDVYELMTSASIGQIRTLFDIIQEKSKNNKNFCAEIAENVLFFTIYNAGNHELSDEELSLQIACINVLAEYNWSRASSSAMSFFDIAQKAYDDGKMSDEKFVNVISKISSLSPIEASQRLSQYLSVLNSSKENSSVSSDDVVRGVIVALGEIGNKQAFDSLLAVTYLDYPEDIVALARDSLARLRW